MRSRPRRATRTQDTLDIGLEPMEPRLCLYSQPVHAALTELGVRFFLDQFGPSEIERFIGTVGQGAYNEDGNGLNPYGDGSITGANSPSLRHFWGRSRRLGDGLLGYDSAPERALSYITSASFPNSALFPSGGVPRAYGAGGAGMSSSYLLLGHIAHLLEDMTVPAHANNDPHLEGFGPLDDPDPYHDWVDGNRVGAPFNRANSYPADNSYKLRRPRDLSPSFITGRTSTDALFRLFLETANSASRYASLDVPGTIPNNPIRSAGDARLAPYSAWTGTVLDAMARDLVPRAITGVGELVRYFYGLVDDKAPTVDLAHLTSQDPGAPQVVRGSTLDLSALATDQDAGDSGVGKRLFKIEIRRRSADGPWSAWETVPAAPEGRAVDDGFTAADTDKPDLLGKHGVKLVYKLDATPGTTYAVRISAEDGAGNIGQSKVYYATAGGGDVDVAFVIDTTGSMADDIDNVKASAASILADLAARNPGARAAVVVYKDFGDSYVTSTLIGFTDDLNAVNSAIQRIYVDGGGDWPEAVLSALHHAITAADGLGAWRGEGASRQIILFGDAPPHDPEPITGYTSSFILDEARSGGVETGEGPFSVLAAGDSAASIAINSVVVNDDSRAISSFSALARSSGGVYVHADSADEVVGALSDAVAAALRPGVSVAGFTSSEDYKDSRSFFTLRLAAPSSREVTVTYRLSGGTALPGDDFAAPTTGSVTFAPGSTLARVPIIIHPDVVAEGDETIEITLDGADGAVLTPGASSAVGTIRDAAFQTGSFSAGSPLTLDTAADPVTLRLAGPGEGTVWYSTERGITSVRAVAITGSTGATSLTITTPRHTRITLGDILVPAGLRSLSADADAYGTVHLGASPASLRLGHLLEGAALELGPAAGAEPAIVLDRVRDASIFSDTRIRSLRATDWLDADGEPDVLSAPSLGALTVTGRKAAGIRGDVQADLRLGRDNPARRRVLDSVVAAGQVDGSTWTINGSIGTITARSTGSDWALITSGSVAELSTTAGSIAGSISGGWIGRISSARDLTGVQVTLAGRAGRGAPSIGSVTARGAITNSTIRAAGGIDSVSATRLIGSRIHLGNLDGAFGLRFAGPAGFPGARLGSLTLSAASRTAFSTSIVTAPTIGALSLGRIDRAGRDEHFGVAATRIDSVLRADGPALASLSGSRMHLAVGDFVLFTTRGG